MPSYEELLQRLKKKARKKPTNRYAIVLPLLQKTWPDACAELRFDPVRRWRFDFAIPSHKVAIEIDGGVWTGGRHTRGQGFLDDCEKLNAAACAGWRVLRFVPAQVFNGQLFDTVKRACREP